MVFWQVISCVSAAAAVIMLIRLISVHRALKEIADGIKEKLDGDTNRLITISSSDRAVCGLASELNVKLRDIRNEQLRLRNGSHELQNAITNIAHDIRTPLTAVSGYLELLEQGASREKAAEYLAVIRERTDTLKELTEELFRYSVIDDTANDLKPERLLLNNELEAAIAAAYQTLSENGIQPVIRITEEPVAVQLDKKALQRIFGNILNNAAGHSDGDLTIVLDSDGSMAFSNPAEALTQIEVGKLFDRFYSVENAKGSTGLGLSIAKLLTEKMGGTIEADLKNGVFTIRLRFDNNGS